MMELYGEVIAKRANKLPNQEHRGGFSVPLKTWPHKPIAIGCMSIKHRRKARKDKIVNMKNLMFLVLVLLLTNSASASLLAAWNFNAQSIGQASTTIAADHGTGSLRLSQLNNISDATIGSPGTTVNEVGGDSVGTDLIIAAGASQRENNAPMIFFLSTSGFGNIILTYATTASGTGFNSQQWSYSTDGTLFTSLSGISGMGTSYSATGIKIVNFSAITALDNEATVYFELTLSGASNGNGTDHFDNFQFNATPVPEPASVALKIFGSFAIGVTSVRRWLSRRPDDFPRTVTQQHRH